MLIGVTGMAIDVAGKRSIAGSGKDTVAAYLVEKHGFVSISFADEMKRICQKVFDFSEEQMWGPSESRNKPDERYRRPPYCHLIANQKAVWEEGYNDERVCGRCGKKGPPPQGPEGECFHYLTPRYTLQMLGTEWGRTCYPDVWLDGGLRVAKKVRAGQEYSREKGLRDSMGPAKGVVFPDVRFINEFRKIRKEGGVVWRVKRKVEGIPKELGEGHISETELLELPDDHFDFCIENNSSISLLEMKVESLMDRLTGKIRPTPPEDYDTPPFLRGRRRRDAY